MAGFLKWAVVTVLSILLLAFIAYLTVSRAIAGTVDASAIKAARFAISGAVPVVGGILSDASEAILAGAGILRNTVGTFGLLAILAICLIPFLQLGVHYLVYKAAAALSSVLADGPLAALIGEIGAAFALLLAMTAAAALLLLCSIISAITLLTG